jgi:N-acetylneuraminic acid mutarotase
VESRVTAIEGSSGVSSPLAMSTKADDTVLLGAGYSMAGLGRPESYTQRASMPTGTSHVINAAVLGTKVYVSGGYIAQGQSTPNMYEYDLVTDKWTARQQMATPRYGHVLIGARGKVYAMGGLNSAGRVLTTEIYDPQLNAWTTGPSMPDHSHYGAAYGILSDGKLHVVGGHDHVTNKVSTSHIVYNFDTNTWGTARSIPVARYWAASGVLSDGKLIVAGGNDGSSVRAETYIYDPATDTWNQAAPMPASIYAHSGGVIAGKFHTFLGYTSTYVNSHFIYDPASNTWSTGATVPYSYHTPSVAQLRGGALLIGGWSSSGVANTTVYEYLAPLYLYSK